jgi:hypothetical protein
MSKPICIFQSPMWTRSGYGDLGLAIAKSILRYDKYDLFVVPTKWGGCSRKFLAEDITDPVEQVLFSKVLRQPLSKQPELFMHCTIPNEYQPPAKFNIGITAGIETTLCRTDWLEGLNRMNFNIVTSQHAKRVFDTTVAKKEQQGQPPIELKSIKPMEVLFWGSDTSIYHKTNVPEIKIEKELFEIEEDFCFLFVGQWTNNALFGDRKDIGNLIRVFLESFANLGPKPKPALIVKTSGAAICNMDKHDMITRLKSLRMSVEQSKGTKDLPNVYLVYGDLTDREMNALYNHDKVKAMVNFTHGEGYGAPILEFSLSGKPILVSNWSGHLDFLNPKLCTLLPGQIAQLPGECANEWLLKESAWFTIDYLKAAEHMKTCFYNYDSYLPKAEQLRVYNMENFSVQAMDKKFHEMLDRVVPKFATETKLVLPKLKKIEKKPEAVESASIAPTQEIKS